MQEPILLRHVYLLSFFHRLIYELCRHDVRFLNELSRNTPFNNVKEKLFPTLMSHRRCSFHRYVLAPSDMMFDCIILYWLSWLMNCSRPIISWLCALKKRKKHDIKVSRKYQLCTLFSWKRSLSRWWLLWRWRKNRQINLLLVFHYNGPLKVNLKIWHFKNSCPLTYYDEPDGHYQKTN